MIVLAILCGSLLSSVASAKSTSVKIIFSDEQLTEALNEALQSHTLEINIDLYDSIEQIEKKLLDAADHVNYYGDYLSQTRNSIGVG